MNMIVKKSAFLVCADVKYYGPTDEYMFFQWVKKIQCIKDFEKKDNILYLYLKSRRLSSLDLFELLGFFKRYKINMKQLRPFLTKFNTKNFIKDKKAYWHKPLFGE